MGTQRHEGWHSAPRRAIGRALLDGPLGEAVIVRRVGGDPGNTNKLLKRMREAGLVEVEHEGKPRVWRLSPGEDSRLLAALERDQPVGEFRAGQRLVLVSLAASDEPVLAQALRATATVAGVAWVARLEGVDGQYLFVLDRDAPALEASLLGTTLERHGISSTRMLVEEVQSPDAFRRTLSAMRAVPRAPRPA